MGRKLRHPSGKQPLCRGAYSVHLVDEVTGRWGPALLRKHNLLPYSWGFLACQCIGLGNPAYQVAGAYLEYQNLVNPTDTVPAPTFDRTTSLTYYNALPANQDFLRVALAGPPTIDIAPGSEPYFIAGVSGNRVTFVAQSSGTQGALGRAFSDTAHSKVYGIALVATPVLADRTHDVILSRGYFNPPDQQLKQVGSQVGVRWSISFL